MGTLGNMTLAQTERAALADLFDDLGPDQPTLDEGWQTGDLLAHLIIRERRPDAMPGAFLKFAEPWTARVAAGYLARPWADLVQLYRSGPPVWNPTRLPKLDEAANGGEMFIHHEDARRGQPDWEPREFDAETTAVLTTMARSAFVRMSLRKAGVGFVAELPGGERFLLRDGQPQVVVRGAPGEIILWSSGRSAVRLELSGDANAVAAVRDAGLRIGV